MNRDSAFRQPSGATAGLPAWAAAATERLEFLALGGQDGRIAAELSAIRSGLRISSEEATASRIPLQRFQRACLDLLIEAADTRTELFSIREELQALCGLARTALDGDCDDRPVNARASELDHLSAVQWPAVRIPGRVVWLGAMVASVPGEESAAAVMLVNDLAAVDAKLPLLALQRAVPIRD